VLHLATVSKKGAVHAAECYTMQHKNREIRITRQPQATRGRRLANEWKNGRILEVLQKNRPMKSLNIKDPEAHRLAAAIAQETGETMTRVVTNALRERFDRLANRHGKASAEELSANARRAAAHVKRPYLDHADFLYDENGLPK